MIFNYETKKISIIVVIIIIFFTKNSLGQYEKLFYDLSIKDINGNIIELSQYKDKAILLVNVASKCGFTKQYASLQKLWSTYKDNGLIVLGVPSNQFGGQEPGNNDEIKNFCEVNFNVNFILTDKVEVKGKNAHPIYLWAKKNYGNSAVPKWNFHKILINKQGKVQDTFASFTEPSSKKIINEIEKILNLN